MKATDALSLEDITLLRKLEHADFIAGRTRLEDTPQRRRLKRLGLIYSSPLNPAGMRAASGKGAWWRITGAGRAALGKASGDA